MINIKTLPIWLCYFKNDGNAVVIYFTKITFALVLVRTVTQNEKDLRMI